MKKKKIWNTPAAKAVGRTKEEDIRFVLIEIAKGRHQAIKTDWINYLKFLEIS